MEHRIQSHYVRASCLLLVLIAAAGCRNSSSNPPPAADSTAFQFSTAPPGDYMRVDRVGMPAVATAVISSGNKDNFNHADPVDDVAGVFVPDIIANVDGFHLALDDDLMAAGLTPCATSECISQAAPLIIPDVVTIDPTTPAGFPNGRRLADPVIDLTLAVALLDLTAHSVDVLAGIPLNPPANDLPFLPDFPYLAPPQ